MYISRKLTKSKQVVPETRGRDPFLFVPEGFDPAQHPGPIAEHPDAALILLSTVYIKHHMRNLDKDRLVNLHTTHLATLMGGATYVRPVREALVDLGFLFCDYDANHDAAKGPKKSYGYKVGEKLLGVTFRERPVASKRLMKRLAYFKKSLEPRITVPSRRHLIDWVHKVQFSDRLDDVIASLPEEPYNVNSHHLNKREFARHQVRLIHSGVWQITDSCRYGRFHSNYTSICGEVRRCLTVEGKPLYEIDIVNSQPYLLAFLLLETFLAEGLNVSDLNPLVFSSHDVQVRDLFLSSAKSSSKVSPSLFSSLEDHSLFFPPFPNSAVLDQTHPPPSGPPHTLPYNHCLQQKCGYVETLDKLGNRQIPQDMLEMVRAVVGGRFYDTGSI